MRADQAGPGAAGDAHRGMADLYRARIDRYRMENQLPAQPQA